MNLLAALAPSGWAVAALARAIKGAELVVLEEGGELIELEQAAEYHRIVAGFIDRHT